MRLAFKKVGPDVVDVLINTFSGRVGFCHVELIYSNGEWFSSTSKTGPRFFTPAYPGQTPDRTAVYQYVDFPVTDEQENEIRKYCQRQVGKKYSHLGCLGFVLPVHEDRRTWFCSEICGAALQHVGYLGHVPYWKLSPNGLWLILKAMEQARKDECERQDGWTMQTLPKVDEGSAVLLRVPAKSNYLEACGKACNLQRMLKAPVILLGQGQSIEVLDERKLAAVGLKRI